VEEARLVRVVAVSPGDVQREREALREIVDELNLHIAPAAGCRLSLWRWETDSWPALHLEGPQGVIDEQMDIASADLVVGIFWKRFGTPTSEAESGTAHELQRAWAAWQESGQPHVMVYFSSRAYSPTSTAETEQWGKVLAFREATPKEQLWWSYRSQKDFEKLARRHLTAWLTNLAPAPKALPAAPAERRIRFNLPLVDATFVGRSDELSALDETFGVADRAVVTQAITGLGGVGKSELAARYVQGHTAEYDVVAWIRAEDGGIADLAELADTLAAPSPELTPQQRAQLALEWLSETERRWLLVLDNVASPDQLPGCVPRAGNGRILVTSRDRALRRYGPLLEIDVFDEDTAMRYLVERAGRLDDEADARTLANALGRLPLALSHAGAYCALGTSFSKYQEMLRDLHAADVFKSGAEHELTVASTWKVSIAAAEQEAPLARDVLAMAAYLAPDAIPRSLFEVLVEDESAAESKRLTDALNALARSSLIAADDESVSVHRLLQKTVRDAGQGDPLPALRALSALAATFPADVSAPSTWELSERLLPHVAATADALASMGEPTADVVAVLNRASLYLAWTAPGPRSLELAEVNLRRAEQALDANDIGVLRARNRVAFMYQQNGRFEEAVAMFRSLVADIERNLGRKHMESLGTRRDLVSALRTANLIEEAIDTCVPLIDDLRRELGPEGLQTLAAMFELASAYHESARSEDAIGMFEELCEIRNRVLGSDHPNVLTTRASLAVAYVGVGRLDEAIALQEAVLADRTRVQGPRHPNTLLSRRDIAYSYARSGRIDAAIVQYELVLTDEPAVLGSSHPRVEGTRKFLATLYRESGRTADAERLEQGDRPALP
jgi:tetratricopeptide (TPR) repeat protein